MEEFYVTLTNVKELSGYGVGVAASNEWNIGMNERGLLAVKFPKATVT